MITLSPALGREIFTELNRLAPLPTDGYLAGGAVANWILSRAWGRELPINDIDIFRVSADFPWTDEVRLSEQRVPTVAAIDMVDGSGGVRFLRVGTCGHRILGCTRDGLLNYIAVQMYDAGSTSALSMLLAGFDLNACQAGIDLATGLLVWTPEFEQFIATRQLQIAFPGTPYQSLIRLAQKQHDLGCYCDLAAEARMLQTCIEASNPERSELCEGHPTWRAEPYRCWFSEKHRVLYERWQDVLSPLARLVGYTPSESLCEEFPFLASPDAAPLYALEITGTSDREELLRWIPETMVAYLTPEEVAIAWSALCRPSVSTARRRRAQMLLRSEALSVPFLRGHLDVEAPFAEQHVRRATAFLAEHGELESRLLVRRRNFAELYADILLLRRMAKKHGDWLLGAISNITAWDEKQDPLLPLCEERLERLAQKTLASVSAEPMVVPLDLSGFVSAAACRELTSSLSLMIEGSTMRHCVGGYANNIARGSCRIFHLDGEGRGSTLELGITSKTRLGQTVAVGEIVQHRARRNFDPPAAEEALGKALLQYVNSHNLLAEASKARPSQAPCAHLNPRQRLKRRWAAVVQSARHLGRELGPLTAAAGACVLSLFSPSPAAEPAPAAEAEEFFDVCF